ncbi:cytoplasmic protein [Bacillus xiapuensis]|uniref:cytoplasmic protein n=1 Tax=Bacillus xiapuensis TaxID=2014075 RepID=UPI000C2499AA|nr:cytoplasmic protein [Bacillus xiapuensis]
MEKRLEKAYEFSSYNRKELVKDEVCGCFHCLKIFHPSEIEDWWDEEETAVCPHCGIDSVIGEHAGVAITKKLLKEMNDRYF